MESTLIKKNIISSLIMQVANVICGIIVPKVILSTFGSEINGLVSSITQFLSYVTLLEGGVSTVIAAALYKPLAQNDNFKLNAVVNAARRFFFQLGMICTAYSFVVAIIYPIFKKTQFSYWYVFALTIVLACSLMTQYFFALSYSILIKSDRKVYVLYNTQTVSIILNAALVIASIYCFKDILAVKMITAGVYALNPVIYSYYAHKHYRLDSKVKPDDTAIAQRWDGFGQTMAYFIHSNTDIIILTLFSSLSVVSIYSIYILIVNSLKGLVGAVSNAVVPSIGNLIGQGDADKIRNAYYRYEYGISLISLVLFSCCMGLIVPFISIYTKEITDANYIQPLFGYLIVLAELVYCFRDPSTGLIYASGHFKQTAKYAYLEAGTNIVISLALVKGLGLVGIAIGTLLAMLLRWILHIFYLRKHIVFTNGVDTLRMAMLSAVDIILLIIIYRTMVPDIMSSYFEWVKYGIMVFLITIFVVGATNFLLNKNRFISFIELCFKR